MNDHAITKNSLMAEEIFIREVIVNYRTTNRETAKFTDPRQVAEFVRSVITDNSREHTVAIYLDGSHRAASYAVISIGTANNALLSPREIFQRAVLVGAISVIIAHNHPSGSLVPSQEDLSVTQRIKEAGEILAIKLLDHVIVSDMGYLSLHESGHLVKPIIDKVSDGISSCTKIRENERTNKYASRQRMRTRRERIKDRPATNRKANSDVP